MTTNLLVLLSIPQDPDHGPVLEWLPTLPELEGATIVWAGADARLKTVDVPEHVIIPWRSHAGDCDLCLTCGSRVVAVRSGWLHYADWRRRTR